LKRPCSAQFSLFVEHFQGWVEIISKLDPIYITGEEPLTVFWRTTISNKVHDKHPAPEEFGSHFN
jgi:hypothetical protein